MYIVVAEFEGAERGHAFTATGPTVEVAQAVAHDMARVTSDIPRCRSVVYTIAQVVEQGTLGPDQTELTMVQVVQL